MNLPSIELPARPKGLRFEVAAVAAARFDVTPNTGLIEIFDSIGGPGVTLGLITGALRSIGQKPVTVQINSYGGDAFEGVAIYNALRAHGHPITTQILGVAASAASLIAMAGDRVEIAKNGQGTVHRAHALVVGTAETLRTVTALLDRLDGGAADVPSVKRTRRRNHKRPAAFESAWATWKCVVSDASGRQESTLACPRCKFPMKEVLTVALAQSDPGLIAYECPSCGYVTSVLTPSVPEPGDR